MTPPSVAPPSPGPPSLPSGGPASSWVVGIPESGVPGTEGSQAVRPGTASAIIRTRRRERSAAEILIIRV
ncbi:Hypothetical protein AA314_05516 [Archangium gephyra]|uniref:Uncharacterized protein n=1 Tax=Archangium gephyra TaxID=48 RepID=A0AAC8QAN8_9BACT|nr:Hypothetical protein AA314_05516 [Archangium gephyra]